MSSIFYKHSLPHCALTLAHSEPNFSTRFLRLTVAASRIAKTLSMSHCIHKVFSFSSKTSTPCMREQLKSGRKWDWALMLTSCSARSGMYSMMANLTLHLASSANSTMAGSSDCASWLIPITTGGYYITNIAYTSLVCIIWNRIATWCALYRMKIATWCALYRLHGLMCNRVQLLVVVRCTAQVWHHRITLPLLTDSKLEMILSRTSGHYKHGNDILILASYSVLNLPRPWAAPGRVVEGVL